MASLFSLFLLPLHRDMKRILSILIIAFICAVALSDCHSEELRESSVITYASVVELTESCPASSMYINTSRQSSSVPMARRVVSQHKHCKITALAEQSQPKGYKHLYIRILQQSELSISNTESYIPIKEYSYLIPSVQANLKTDV